MAGLGVLAALSTAVPRTSAASRLPGEYGTVWVTNRTLNNVTAFDAGTGAVVGTVGVGSSPIGVVAPLFKGKVYTSDEGSHQVSVISRASRSPLTVIPVGPKPHHMMASTLGDRVYVAEFGSNTVGVIVTASDTKVATCAASPNTGARTHAVWPSRDGRRLYATNEGTNDIDAIDTSTGQLLWNLAVGDRPSEILDTLDGRTPQLQVTTLSVPGTTTGHQGLSLTGRYIYVATEGAGTDAGLAVIDNTAAELVAHYPYPGGGRPHGVFYDPLPSWYGA